MDRDWNDDRGVVGEIVERELTEADTVIPAAIDEALHVEQRKPLPVGHDGRVRDVFLTAHHTDRDLALGDRIAMLVVQDRRKRRGATAEVVLLQHNVFLALLE